MKNTPWLYKDSIFGATFVFAFLTTQLLPMAVLGQQNSYKQFQEYLSDTEEFVKEQIEKAKKKRLSRGKTKNVSEDKAAKCRQKIKATFKHFMGKVREMNHKFAQKMKVRRRSTTVKSTNQKRNEFDNNVSFVQTGKASYYAEKFHGRKTANGEIFNMHDLTAAHRELPFNTVCRVTNLSNGKSVVVRINDRGPFKDKHIRIIDLSKEAAKRLGALKDGIIDVKVEVLANG